MWRFEVSLSRKRRYRMPTFHTTHWSLVLAAGREGTPRSAEALAELCGKYWPPVYAYVRRRVADVHEAQDLTQEFFARLLEKQALGKADPQRGRFRAFLLTAVKNFLANERDRADAQKRGGGRAVLPFDFAATDSRLSAEPADTMTPERLFDRQWAVLLLETALARLRAEYDEAGKGTLFERLKGGLSGEAGLPLAEIARALDMTEAAVKSAAHRLRKRYRELLRGEVSETMADGEDIDDEIHGLFAALGNR
jgi:RNA polymerase sigma-70 factor (ECF subfamily)